MHIEIVKRPDKGRKAAWVIALETIYATDPPPRELHIIKDKIYQVTSFTGEGDLLVICEDGIERYISLAEASPDGRLISPLEMLARQVEAE